MYNNKPLIRLIKVHWARYRKINDSIKGLEKALICCGYDADQIDMINEVIENSRNVMTYHYNSAKELQVVMDA